VHVKVVTKDDIARLRFGERATVPSVLRCLVCGIQVRYRKDPHMQNSMRTLKLTLTLTLTTTDTGGAVLTLMLGYRSLYITWQ